MLVLITSAADRRDHRRPHAPGSAAGPSASRVISAVFLYTTVVNVIERPDGVKIGACFIAGIIARLAAVPAGPRLRTARHQRRRWTTWRERFVRDIASRRIRFIANEPDHRDAAEYRDKIEQIRADNDIPDEEDFVFVEVTVTRPLRLRSRR